MIPDDQEENKTPPAQEQMMLSDVEIPSTDDQVKPPSDNRLKILISVCVLLLVIGFVSTAQMREKSSRPSETSIAPADNNSPSIDSSFFNLNNNKTAAVPPKAGQPSASSLSTQNPTSASSQQSAPSPRIQSPIPSSLITADEYLVGNLATGKIYFEKEPTVKRPIASISKLITAMVVQQNMDPNSLVTVASSSVTGYEQKSDVHPGETFSVSDLLTGMILISSNDSALTFANNFGYPAFISDMNATVKELGMNSTSFKDPSGLSPYNISDADDLFKLARYIYANDQGLLAITKTPTFDLATTTEHDAHNFVNIDPFVYDPHYLGGKTGRTDAAGETMLSMFNLPTNDGSTTPVAIIVLHSDMEERQIDSSMLVEQVLEKIDSDNVKL